MFRVVLATVAAAGFLSAAVLPCWAEEAPPEAHAALEALGVGDLTQALSLSELAASGTQSTPAWKVRGYVLLRAGEVAAAVDAYEAAVRHGPQDAVAHNNLGTAYLAQNNLAAAERSFRSALSLQPMYGDARNNLGVALERSGRASQAREAYLQATLTDPLHARAWNNLGVMEAQRGQVEAAARALARAIELDPELDVPALNLALLGGTAALDEAALERLEVLASRAGAGAEVRARALAAQAAQHAAAGRTQEAVTLYLQAVTLMPADPALLNNLAVLEDQLGQDRDALLHLEEALGLDANLSVVRNNMGIVHVHRGRLDMAEGTFREVLRHDPTFHRAYYNLGVVHAARGELTLARAAFLQASRLAPSDGDVIYNLGLLARETGGGVRAERLAYERALSLDPKLAEAHLALGTLLADPATPAALRDREQARIHLLRFLELALPGDEVGRSQASAWLRWLQAPGAETATGR